MKEFRKRYWYEVALCASFIPLIYSPIAYTVDIGDKLVAVTDQSNDTADKDTYTINFNNISIIELIRFASKITNLNFVFEEANLQFSVTVVSEEPISAKSLMAALSQVLRMHSLILLEEDGNVLITNNASVRQIPPIVSGDLPDSQPGNAALVTRVFRIKNANVNTIAGIIRPMSSQGALIEVSVETRQLIVTDITTNVDQIAALLTSLDAPHTPLDIETFVVKNIAPQDLIVLTQQILSPFTEGNPLIFVPQADTNSIFIVSTPYLIERAITVMEDLDIPTKTQVVGKQGLAGKNILLYKTVNRTPDELTQELQQVAKELTTSAGGAASPLTIAIDNLQEITDTGSLMFVADPDTLARIKEILSSLDTPSAGKTSFYIYKIQHASEDQMNASFHQMQEKLQEAPRPDTDLIDAIGTMKWIKETNSLVFTGTDSALKKLAEILPTFDVNPTTTGAQTKSNFFVYHPQYRTGEELSAELSDLASNLKDSGLADPSFLQTLDSMKWVSSTKSLVFTGDPQSIDKIQGMLKTMDTPARGKTAFYIYKIQHAGQDQIEESLKKMEETLVAAAHPDTDLIDAIESVKWIKETNSLIFTGSDASLKKLEEVVPTFDVTPTGGNKGAQAPARSSFFVYHPQYRSGDDLATELSDLESTLKDSALADPSFLETLNSIKWVPSTNSLIFTGDPLSIEKVQAMLKAMDTPTAFSSKSSQVFIYKPVHISPDQIQNALKSLEPALQSTNALSDQNLVTAINAMQWNAETQSFMVTSDAGTIDRLKGLLSSIDTAQTTTGEQAKGFYLYKLQNAKCDTVLAELKNISSKMPPSTLQNQNLVAAIDRIECIQSNNSLLITGSPGAIEQIKTLIVEFDTKTAPVLPVGAQSFLIYKPKYLPGPEIQAALSDLATDLQAAGLDDPQLFQVLQNMKFVAQTGSLLFTGSQAGLDKVQTLIDSIDNSSALGAIQSIGNLTFLLYKVQSASPDKLITSLKTFAIDLKQSNVEDKELADAINTVKWIKETNSLMFTGSNQALEKVEQLVQKFDLPSLGGPIPVERNAPTFVIYNPKYLSGDELISILCDFVQNLATAGVSDPGLFDTVSNLKWIDKTSSLLVSGDQKSIEKVQQLLAKFDIPNKENATPSIDSIDNTSFLVYKLQFHPGNDIQSALKQVAASLGKGSTTPTAIVDAISSLQWIQVTNSLLCTGQQDVLVKLKDLIQDLDIPLRQVFIEVLVIETGLQNTQNFGLMWGGQVKYLNKTILQSGNFPLSPSQGSSTPATTFPTNLQNISATTTPTGNSIPFSTGFDLGVIGDIIMHKGKSFISLGSLMNAVQLDSDSTILLNPKIITQDNRQSTVFVGTNVPYTGALVTNSSNSTVSTANIEYRDVGVSLTITPLLGDGDVITMDIVQDISEVIGAAPGTTSNQVTGITTSHTHMETRVHVPNNHFVALSGMINESKTHFRTGIPCLGGLPVIGVLFSENDRTAVKNNVIIFVRPQIVTSYQEYKEITEHQEWLYKDRARLPVLKEEFDEGIDIVKLPLNE